MDTSTDVHLTWHNNDRQCYSSMSAHAYVDPQAKDWPGFTITIYAFNGMLVERLWDLPTVDAAKTVTEQRLRRLHAAQNGSRGVPPEYRQALNAPMPDGYCGWCYWWAGTIRKATKSRKDPYNAVCDWHDKHGGLARPLRRKTDERVGQSRALP